MSAQLCTPTQRRGHRPMRGRWVFGCARATRGVTHPIPIHRRFPSFITLRCLCCFGSLARQEGPVQHGHGPRTSKHTTQRNQESRSCPEVSPRFAPEEARRSFYRSAPGRSPEIESALPTVETQVKVTGQRPPGHQPARPPLPPSLPPSLELVSSTGRRAANVDGSASRRSIAPPIFYIDELLSLRSIAPTSTIARSRIFQLH